MKGPLWLTKALALAASELTEAQYAAWLKENCKRI